MCARHTEKAGLPTVFCFQRTVICRWHCVFQRTISFSAITIEKAWCSVFSALFLPESKSPHSSRLHTRLINSGIVCFSLKLLWKLALVERTKGVVRETTVIVHVSHYFLRTVICRWHCVFQRTISFSAITIEKAWCSVFSALFLPESKSPHSSRLHTRLINSGIVCFSLKLLWKLALVERTKGVVRETTVIVHVSHYFLLGNWVVQGNLG